MSRPLKVYALYDGPDGPSAQSKWYGRYSKNLYHVAAYSIKQAVFVVAHDEWSTGGVGILEYSDATQQWFGPDKRPRMYAVLKVGAAREISQAEIDAVLAAGPDDDAGVAPS